MLTQQIHLHSIMLLLYQKGKPYWSPTLVIYIPLCFYFIRDRAIIEVLRSTFTFHYASTLSSPTSNTLLTSNGIYIPLCFYFIRDHHEIMTSGFRIYIPLCFYFIFLYRDHQGHGILFTFHYASTLSCHRRCCSHDQQQFTFHYASTLSWQRNTGYRHGAAFTFHYASTLSLGDASGLDGQQHLHSIMLLLYQLQTNSCIPTV